MLFIIAIILLEILVVPCLIKIIFALLQQKNICLITTALVCPIVLAVSLSVLDDACDPRA